MYMVNLQPGQRARVLDTNRGGHASRRLFDLGIMPGSEIELVDKHPFHGPLVLKVGTAKLALGRGIAAGVTVELLEAGDKPQSQLVTFPSQEN